MTAHGVKDLGGSAHLLFEEAGGAPAVRMPTTRPAQLPLRETILVLEGSAASVSMPVPLDLTVGDIASFPKWGDRVGSIA